MFQFTHPGRGATRVSIVGRSCLRSFNSRTPGGVRRAGGLGCLFLSSGFNSRTPGGVRQRVSVLYVHGFQVSIHAPREGCDRPLLCQPSHSRVSIHAPREGCDRYHL